MIRSTWPLGYKRAVGLTMAVGLTTDLDAAPKYVKTLRKYKSDFDHGGLSLEHLKMQMYVK
jgi:hypothetical protein